LKIFSYTWATKVLIRQATASDFQEETNASTYNEARSSHKEAQKKKVPFQSDNVHTLLLYLVLSLFFLFYPVSFCFVLFHPVSSFFIWFHHKRRCLYNLIMNITLMVLFQISSTFFTSFVVVSSKAEGDLRIWQWHISSKDNLLIWLWVVLSGFT